MSNILIRDIPDGVIAAIDAHASALGLSRNEYVRRQLVEDAQRSRGPVTASDLQQLAVRFGDLADPEVMAQAWS